MEIESLLRESNPSNTTDVGQPDSPEGLRIKAQALGASVAPPARASARRQHRRVTLPIAALAVIAATAILLVTLLPAQLGTEGSRAAAALNDLASAAASQPSLGPGQYDYTEVELQPTGVTASGVAGSTDSWTQYSVGTVQTWVAADGSGRQVTSTDLNPHFLTAADKAAWAKSGSKFDEPPSYVVTEQEFGSGGQGLTGNPPPGNRPRPYNVATLPIDPTQLAKTLCGSRVWKALPSEADSLVGYSIAEPEPSGCQLFGIVITLLQGPDVGSTPALRQALFKVLADVKGVRLVGSASDATGKRGVELQLIDRRPAGSTKVTCTDETPSGPQITKRVVTHHPAMSTNYTVIVDPTTALLLSLERSFSPTKTDVNSLLGCAQAPSAGHQLEEQIPDRSVLLSSGVVDSTSAVAMGTTQECAQGSIPEPPWNICRGARNDGDK
jgi:hypothetical protein